MHIVDVKFAAMTDCPETGRRTAKVMLLTNEGGLSLAASTEQAENSDRHAIIEGLMQDAMRQIRAFPEVRTGQTTVTVAEDALDRAAQEG
ncbi:hypothetical protein FDP25_07930 [Roseovarius sp. A21]|uniref:Uncharacterized protein n=1 Tax=Roseovarius bejariae TaxID=2576383 RepID=A0A844D0E6_9RHOB|nr:hypothetical protein [Roseovarius bejariae]MRU15353.1 hypothetical protein [Roseovarius bejariae]